MSPSDQQRFDTETGVRIDPWKRIAALERELAAMEKDRDHFFKLSGRYLDELAAASATQSPLREALEDQREAWIDTRDNPAADEWIKGFAQQQIDAADKALATATERGEKG